MYQSSCTQRDLRSIQEPDTTLGVHRETQGTFKNQTLTPLGAHKEIHWTFKNQILLQVHTKESEELMEKHYRVFQKKAHWGNIWKSKFSEAWILYCPDKLLNIGVSTGDISAKYPNIPEKNWLCMYMYLIPDKSWPQQIFISHFCLTGRESRDQRNVCL